MVQGLIDTAAKHYREALKIAARTDVTAFGEYLDDMWFPARHHEVLCDNLMAVWRGDIERLAISMPPGHAKSTWASHIFPVFYLGTKPTSKFLQAGHTQDFCDNQFGKKCRGLLQSAAFKEVFPEVELSPDSKAAGFWQLNNPHGYYLTRGVGGGISGFRSSIASVDDPIPSREAAESQSYRDKLYDWYTSDFYTRLLPGAPLYVVATRWHPDDLIGRLENAMKAGKGDHYEIINFPAIAEEDDPLGREPGEALWPEFFTIEKLNQIKLVQPPRDWSSLYMGQPYVIGGSIVQADWIQYYDELPKKEDIRRVFMSVDCANTATQRADYTAITVWLEDRNKKYFLIDVVRERAEFTELIVMVERTASLHEVSAILVEEAGAGNQLLQLQQGKMYAPLVGIATNNKNKEFRFDAVSPLFQAGQVLLPKRAAWLDDFLKELTEFPTGKHDDMVDSTSQALAWARGGTSRRRVSKIRGANIAR